MKTYADITITFRVEADDCKDAIEQVNDALGQNNDLAADWPTVEKVGGVEE